MGIAMSRCHCLVCLGCVWSGKGLWWRGYVQCLRGCHCWVLCLVSIAQSSDAMAGQGVACNVRIIALCYILALLLGAFSATAECHVWCNVVWCHWCYVWPIAGFLGRRDGVAEGWWRWRLQCRVATVLLLSLSATFLDFAWCCVWVNGSTQELRLVVMPSAFRHHDQGLSQFGEVANESFRWWDRDDKLCSKRSGPIFVDAWKRSKFKEYVAWSQEVWAWCWAFFDAGMEGVRFCHTSQFF